MPFKVRIDHNYTHGWQVRVGPVGPDQVTSFFADRKHGGVEAAGRAADAAMGAMAQGAPAERPRHGARSKAQSNNTSGIIGIRPVYRRGKYGKAKSKSLYLYMQVSWSEHGTPCCSAFSAHKHGVLGAVEMALTRRQEKTGALLNLTPRQAWNRMRHLTVGRA